MDIDMYCSTPYNLVQIHVSEYYLLGKPAFCSWKSPELSQCNSSCLLSTILFADTDDVNVSLKTCIQCSGQANVCPSQSSASW